MAIADASVLLASCNAALDDCAELTDADIKLIARSLKDVLTKDRSPYQACFDLQQRQVEELVLALMWCKPRLKQEAYQRHIEWTLTKYPKPPKVDEPRIVHSDTLPGKNHSTDDALAPVEQSAKRIGDQPEAAHGDGCRVESFKNPDADFCPSDLRGPG